MNEKQVPQDPAIAEVREARHRISARVGHDPARLVARYIELQQQYADRLLPPMETSQSEKPAA